MLEKIKLAMADRNVKKVAEATGMSPHTIYRILNNKGYKTSSLVVKVLADYLKIER